MAKASIGHRVACLATCSRLAVLAWQSRRATDVDRAAFVEGADGHRLDRMGKMFYKRSVRGTLVLTV